MKLETKNLVGTKFGKLLVVEEAKRGKFNELRLNCVCDCGNFKNVSRSHLLYGDVASCGCWRNEFKKIHGLSKSQTYRTWEGIIGRCENENNDRFKDYGGRGITVCEAWKNFEAFYADMGERPKGTSIDRINNNGNYEPKNCRWASSKEQSRNSRKNRMIEFDNKIKCLAEWSELLGINYSTLRKRLSRGWSITKAFTATI